MRFRQMMARLGRDRTILLSTHVVADLGGGCQMMALLDRGQVVFQGSPDDLLRPAVGRVFEIEVSTSAADQLEANYEIVSRSATPQGVTLRGVAANGLPDGAAAVESPNLEEAYLAFMAGRGRTEAARQDEDADADE